ncbi:AfsR/SARP family transcriptional regulator [Allokutzneria albata]|uniref:Transcriptional activator domain-containing protein n=1 Tax=Allokutzneria albata TaxID=211114 RepID=A0A1G9U6T9_ALLAB|nr:BTAD domain-containing putative transcriptional regulator [Allokutzneria albata]SDM55275.1 transcriptional activator domain-containing protein [Allokutzneria albata]
MPLGGTKQRVLLAHLLLNVNKLVPFDQLVEVIWPSGEPPSAHANLQTYMWRLRRRLPEFPPDQGLITHPTGYSPAVAPGTVDARLFEELRAAATRARQDGSPQRALELAQRAEALWSGDPPEACPCCTACRPTGTSSARWRWGGGCGAPRPTAPRARSNPRRRCCPCGWRTT